MPSSPIERRDALPGSVLTTAERLCKERVVSGEPCGGGKNNRVYKIRTARATYAMKCYGSAELDGRDRLGHEFDGLHFLKASGIGSALPAALAVDRGARCALYEWIDGVAVAHRDGDEIGEVLAFLTALHGVRGARGAETMPPATEAVLRLADLADQITLRLERLSPIARSEPELETFLRDELGPETERRLAQLSGFDVRSPLTPGYRTLSPSDFGFHNALRRADGSIAFIDFEYFGWDDPVKLVADFLWHPAMQLSEAERRRFRRGAEELYRADPAFTARLQLCYPLYGIRWTLIILNEFLPELWERRGFAGGGGDWAAAKREQLRKARANLAALRSWTEGISDESRRDDA
jgi:hypothetical protein